MNELEFARFIKSGLGTPSPSPTLASRIAAEISARGRASDIGGSTLVGPAEPGVAPRTSDQRGTRRRTARRLAYRFGGAALALGLVAGINLAGVYYFPRYGTALANAPLVGGVSRSFLSNAGLLTADTSAFNDTATSNGHTLRLVAGYADGLQTVFLIEIDGQSLANAGPPRKTDHYLVVAPGATLTDQFGHRYQRDGSPSGDQRPVVFSPLVSPPAENGARLTLHVDGLLNVGSTQFVVVAGDWTLHATLFAHRAHSIPLPAPMTLAGNTYTFTSIRSSATRFEISWKVSGPGVAQAWSEADGHGSFAALDPFIPSLVGLHEVGSTGGPYTYDDPSTHTMSGTITSILNPPGGTCRVRFGSPSIGYVERTIVLPAN
jgi:hypothetical protein